MMNIPPVPLILLFLTNLIVPNYLANKIDEVNIFRQIFFLMPLVLVYSWALAMKSIFCGLMAAIMWKTYDSEIRKIGAPQDILILRIIIELSLLYLTICLFFMLSNMAIFGEYKDWINTALFLKLTINFGILILFRPPSYYLCEIEETIWELTRFLGPLAFFLKKGIIMGFIVIYSIFEYYCYLHQDKFFINVTDKNLTQLTQISLFVIVGRVFSGFFTHFLKRQFKTGFPIVLGCLAHCIAAIIVLRRYSSHNVYKAFADCDDTFDVDLIWSTFLFSFGDACYSNFYLNLNLDFTDQTSEAFALVKNGQTLLLSFLAYNLSIGYVIAFSIFYYLCSINIQNKD